MKTAKVKGDDLETAVRTLEQTILAQSPGYNEKTFRIEAKKIISVDGVHHELDIWVSVEIGQGYNATFIFECKNWQAKISKNDIIVFSEKIKAANAQTGYFVARAFTRDAIAQAKADPRITLLRVREVSYSEMPHFLEYFHCIEDVASTCSVNVMVRDGEAHAGTPMDPAQLILLHGEEASLKRYAENWLESQKPGVTSQFASAKLPGEFILCTAMRRGRLSRALAQWTVRKWSRLNSRERSRCACAELS